MYKKLKEKLEQLFHQETKKEKYQEMLKKFHEKIIMIKIKDDTSSQEEILIMEKLIEKVKIKI